MQDVLLQKNDNGDYDIVFENGNISGVEGLETSIITSLHTDARADAGSVKDPLMRRGWIGNLLNTDTGRELGSRLWLADQARNDQNAENYIKSEVKNCLNWMTEDRIVQEITVSTTKLDKKTISVLISLYNNSSKPEQYTILFQSTTQISGS